MTFTHGQCDKWIAGWFFPRFCQDKLFLILLVPSQVLLKTANNKDPCCLWLWATQCIHFCTNLNLFFIHKYGGTFSFYKPICPSYHLFPVLFLAITFPLKYFTRRIKHISTMHTFDRKFWLVYLSKTFGGTYDSIYFYLCVISFLLSVSFSSFLLNTFHTHTSYLMNG